MPTRGSSRWPRSLGMRMSRCQPRRKAGAVGSDGFWEIAVVEWRWTFGVRSCTTKGTVGEFVTRSTSAGSPRRPGRQAMWVDFGFQALVGVPGEGVAMGWAASRTAARRSPLSALRTTRKPSRSKVSRCSSLSFTKSIGSLPDHAAVLHLAVRGRQDLRVREERLHVPLRDEGVAGALLLRRELAEVFALDVELLAVDEEAPRRRVGARAHGHAVVVPDVAALALQAPVEVVPLVLFRPGLVMVIDEGEGERAAVVQQRLELRDEVEHVARRRVREDRVGDDVVEALADLRQLQAARAVRVEEKRPAVEVDPVRGREHGLAALDRLAVDVDAPVALLVDRGTGVAKDVADVAAEVEDVLAAPDGVAPLLRKVGELAGLFGHEGHGALTLQSRWKDEAQPGLVRGGATRPRAPFPPPGPLERLRRTRPACRIPLRSSVVRGARPSSAAARVAPALSDAFEMMPVIYPSGHSTRGCSVELTSAAEGRKRTNKDFEGPRRKPHFDTRRALSVVRKPHHPRQIRPDPGRHPQGRAAQARRRRKADPRAAGEGNPRAAAEARRRARQDPQAVGDRQAGGREAPPQGDRRGPPDPPERPRRRTLEEGGGVRPRARRAAEEDLRHEPPRPRRRRRGGRGRRARSLRRAPRRFP